LVVATADHPGVAVGLLLPTREDVVAGRSEPRKLLALAEFAEQVGFDSVWAGESPVARPRLDPLVLLAAVAARTERIGLGTAVMLPALRSPVPLAQTIASLDQVAGGRLTLGFGAGFPFPATEAEFRVCGVPFEERTGRLVETVKILRLLWAEDHPVSFEGRYWSFDELLLEPRPRQRGGPPLWLAGGGRKALARVGRLFDGWLPYSPTPELFASGLAAVRAAAEEADRPSDAVVAAIYLTVALDDDPARAERALEEYTQAYYGLPFEGMRQLQAFYGGDAAGLLACIADYVDAGARQVILRFATLGDPRAMAISVSDEVLPAVRARLSVGQGSPR
jgi:probable F420-dependent oxidoreductase